MSPPVAIVAGGSGGIGAAVVSRFAADGWRTVTVDVAYPAAAPPGHEVVLTDLADADAAPAAAEAVLRATSRVDALVYACGTQVVAPAEEIDVGQWDRLFAVNVRGLWQLATGLLPALTAAGAPVVAVGSVHGHATSQSMAAYAASKAALAGLVRGLAIEWAPRGVRVNAVVPGAVDTPMLTDHLLPPELDALRSRTPLARIASAREIAEVVCFLAGPSASFVTGQELVVDGGVLASLASEGASKPAPGHLSGARRPAAASPAA